MIKLTGFIGRNGKGFSVLALIVPFGTLRKRSLKVSKYLLELSGWLP